ncbi:MAG: pyridoxamine kinase [Oscillospiraceae bacterium]|nr:pyridoxamine kinase [Oscillospiraceae bacterium]
MPGAVPDHNRQKKIAAINDMTGFGRCSLAAEIPVISRLGVQCCAVPTAILSNHTGFASCFLDDYTRHFRAYTAEWKKLDLRFRGILTGFLGSEEQFVLVEEFLDTFAGADTVICVDPVMGDNGCAYRSYTPAMCTAMGGLVRRAHIITPNLTEACLLTGTAYHEGVWHRRELLALLAALRAMGPEKIVVTGIPQGEFIANLAADGDAPPRLIRQHRIGESRSGVGDVFSAVIAADAVCGAPFLPSVCRASSFVKKCIRRTVEMGIPRTDGLCLEEVLGQLRPWKGEDHEQHPV